MNVPNYDLEIKRKLFHLYSLIFPLIYLFISKSLMVIILLIIVGSTLYIDIFRNYNSKIKDLVDKFFRVIMRNEEISGNFKLSGSSYMALGFFLSALFFSKELAITSWLILIISDTFAALIGIKIGKKLSNGKSFEGSGAFLISAFFISIIAYFFLNYSTNFFIILISCILTTYVEFHSKRINIDDNVLIPVTYCFSTAILNLIF